MCVGPQTDHKRFILNCYDLAKKADTTIRLSDPAALSILLESGLSIDQIYKTSGFEFKIGCMAARYRFGILPNGDITPCPLVDRKIGNIRSISSIRQLFDQSVLIRRIREGQSERVVVGCMAHGNAEPEAGADGMDPYEKGFAAITASYEDLESLHALFRG